jgi:hypothetical protein
VLSQDCMMMTTSRTIDFKSIPSPASMVTVTVTGEHETFVNAI